MASIIHKEWNFFNEKDFNLKRIKKKDQILLIFFVDMQRTSTRICEDLKPLNILTVVRDKFSVVAFALTEVQKLMQCDANGEFILGRSLLQ